MYHIILNKIRFNINRLIIPILIRYNFLNLLSLLFLINLRRIKKILPKKKHKYKIIVLGKLAGNEDLYASQIKYNKDILYYDCPRHFFKIIFKNLIKNSHLISDNKYLSNNEETEISKEYYQKYIIKLLNNLKKMFPVNAFIGFNFRYHAERELHAACTKLKIPFLVLHKESTVTEYEKKFVSKVHRNYIGRYQGKKIGVYSNDEKKELIKDKIAKKNQINVIGCSRLDKSFRLRDETPENQILYYIIDNHRGLPNRFFKIYGTKFFQKLIDKDHTKNFSWKKQHLETLKILKDFAIKNPKVKIILKGKQGNKIDKSEYQNLPSNIKFFYGGIGHNLIHKSKIIIGLNTTALLEGIAANRFILIPFFFKKKSNFIKKCYLELKLKPKNYFYSNKDFFTKTKYFLNLKYKKYKKNNNFYSLNKYLTNTKGMASLKLNKFIRDNIVKDKKINLN